MFPAFVAAQNFDFDPQKIDRDLRIRQARKTDGILLGRHDHLQIPPNATGDETLQLGLGVAVMIDITFGQFDSGAEFAQSVFKAFRGGDAAERTDVGVAQFLQGQLLAGHDILQMQRLDARIR